jgi:putative addiction module component (TIGR02574 family)
MLETTNTPAGVRALPMARITNDDIAGMSPAERIVLIGQLWDSLGEGELCVSPAQAAELARRLDSFDADRADAVAWRDLKAALKRPTP